MSSGTPDREGRPALARRLGTSDAVVIGLGSMVGAGIFAALAPAAAAAGDGLLIGLAVAAVVAYLNATSTARCAARYPESGGAYVYGRQRLGEFWGYLAGWGFVVGKTASCAAMALVVGFYAWPAHAHAVAVAAVIVLTALNYTDYMYRPRRPEEMDTAQGGAGGVGGDPGIGLTDDLTFMSLSHSYYLNR